MYSSFEKNHKIYLTALNVSNNIEIAQTAHNRYCDQLRFCGNKLDDCSAKDEKNEGR